jgi:hypothetical protein
MIEFLPPREGAFGSGEEVDFVGFDGDDDGGFDDEPPRSRWLTALAVVGVTALLAGGVIAAAPWDGEEVSTPPTTVPATTTTAPRPTTTSVAPEPTLPPGFDTDPPGMLLSGPSSFQLAGAQSDQGYGTSAGDPLEVWASPDAARTSGRWVVIDSREMMGDFENLRRGAVRIDVGGRRALMTVAVDGVVEVELPPTDGVGFAITSFGLGLDQIARIAATVSIDARGIDHGDLLDPGGPLEGLELRVADDTDFYPWGGVVGPPDAWSYFVDTASGDWVQVTVDRPTPTEQTLADLVAAVPIDVATLDPDELAGLAALTEQVDDPSTLLVATDGRETSFLVVKFALGNGQQVTVSSSADLDDVLMLSAQLELAGPDAWREASIESVNGPGVQFESDPPTGLGLGGDATDRWSAQVDQRWFTISGNDYYFSSPFDPVSGPTVTAYRSLDHAFLLVTNTWPNDGLRVVVEQQGLEPQELDLRQVGDTPVYAGAAEIDGDLPVAISWFALDGTPIEGPTSVP